VNLHFETAIDDFSTLSDVDLILASDGIGSQIRTKYQSAFGTEIQLKSNRFVWMGSTKPLAAFTYFFRNTPHGLIVAHTYQYEPGMSTWIFECSDDTWQKWQFEIDNEKDTVAKIEEIFKDELDGHGLITNKSYWRQFPHVTNKNWSHQNIVLLGDAKATAHYSIGSGTKLAMDSAIGLSDAVIAHPDDLQKAFALYDTKRRQTVEMIQHAALVSLDWFENMDRYNQQSFYQFAFGCMTRSKKVTFENLRLRDASFTDKVLEEFNLGQIENCISPAFTPFKIGKMAIKNRLLMAPMMQYEAINGCVTPWHLVHYGSRATQGVGLIYNGCTVYIMIKV
jgi:anthraniloyl-CoA monooxygenase